MGGLHLVAERNPSVDNAHIKLGGDTGLNIQKKSKLGELLTSSEGGGHPLIRYIINSGKTMFTHATDYSPSLQLIKNTSNFRSSASFLFRTSWQCWNDNRFTLIKSALVRILEYVCGPSWEGCFYRGMPWLYRLLWHLVTYCRLQWGHHTLHKTSVFTNLWWFMCVPWYIHLSI